VDERDFIKKRKRKRKRKKRRKRKNSHRKSTTFPQGMNNEIP
jgi:hypothetical protein